MTFRSAVLCSKNSKQLTPGEGHRVLCVTDRFSMNPDPETFLWLSRTSPIITGILRMPSAWENGFAEGGHVTLHVMHTWGHLHRGLCAKGDVFAL